MTAVLATAIVAVTGGTVLAASTSHKGTTHTAFSVTTENSARIYGPGAGPQPGGWFTVGSTEIDANGGDNILVRFTSESACFGGGGYCAARILVDGTEAEPVSNPGALDFAFDSTNNNTATVTTTESHTMERVLEYPGMGGTPAQIEVQVKMVGGAGVRERLDDWTLAAHTITP